MRDLCDGARAAIGGDHQRDAIGVKPVDRGDVDAVALGEAIGMYEIALPPSVRSPSTR